MFFMFQLLKYDQKCALEIFQNKSCKVREVSAPTVKLELGMKTDFSTMMIWSHVTSLVCDH